MIHLLRRCRCRSYHRRTGFHVQPCPRHGDTFWIALTSHLTKRDASGTGSTIGTDES